MTSHSSRLTLILDLAASHPPFAAALARDPAATAAAAGITLTPAEQRALAASAAHGMALIAGPLGERIPEADRRRFLALATGACAALAAAGCGKPGSRPRPAADAAPALDSGALASADASPPPRPDSCAQAPRTVGTDDRLFATGTGIRPDRPPPRPTRPQVTLTLDRVESASDWGQKVLPGLARGLLPRLALALSHPDVLPEICAGELRISGQAGPQQQSEMVSLTGPYREEVGLAIMVKVKEVIIAFRPEPPPPDDARYTLVLKVARLP